MPMLVIQAMTTSGKMVEGARWSVDVPWLQEGHSVSLNVPVKDPALIGYVGKAGSVECVVDKDEGKYSVSLACKVVRLRHMVNVGAGTSESLAIVTPVNRLVEHVLMYIMQPAKCDPRFVALVRGEQPIQPAKPEA